MRASAFMAWASVIVTPAVSTPPGKCAGSMNRSGEPIGGVVFNAAGPMPLLK